MLPHAPALPGREVRDPRVGSSILPLAIENERLPEIDDASKLTTKRLQDPRANLPAVRSGRVYVVNGSHYFSRPGPRLVDSLEILAHALDPEVHPLPPGLPRPLRVAPAETAATA